MSMLNIRCYEGSSKSTDARGFPMTFPLSSNKRASFYSIRTTNRHDKHCYARRQMAINTFPSLGHLTSRIKRAGKYKDYLLICKTINKSPMNYWLVKTEPDTFSWTTWLGIKKRLGWCFGIFRPANNLKGMKREIWLSFTTRGEKAVVGIGKS